MTTRQLRAQLNTPKRKHALPLLILLRQRAQTLCQEWNTAQANNQPLPGTPYQVSKFTQNGPNSLTT